MESGTDGRLILETHELTKRFGQLTAVDRLTIALNPGDVFGLLATDVGVLVLATTALVLFGGNLYLNVVQ